MTRSSIQRRSIFPSTNSSDGGPAWSCTTGIPMVVNSSHGSNRAKTSVQPEPGRRLGMTTLGRLTAGIVSLILLESVYADASDIYVFRFRSSSVSVSCAFGTSWQDDLIFHNTGAQ